MKFKDVRILKLHSGYSLIANFYVLLRWASLSCDNDTEEIFLDLAAGSFEKCFIIAGS